MSLADLSDWFGEHLRARSVWYLKRLSGNDTLANGAHQAGPYVPKELLFEVIPTLHDSSRRNPDAELSVSIDSHGIARSVRAVWYNNKWFNGTRDEARITGWGGRQSPILDPDSTGGLAVFVFETDASRRPILRIWFCRNTAEEEFFEYRISPVEPGQHVIWRPRADDIRGVLDAARNRSPTCRLTREQLPLGWLTVFPSGFEIVRKVCELRPPKGESVDERLLARRECEFDLFQSVEEAIESPLLKQGFRSIAEFLTHAQRILQRRKTRSGRSLELHTREILLEEGFVQDRDFAHQPESDLGKRPDFLFPSEAAYKDPRFPADRLRLLAAKTTCKDRWRQVLNEADRIREKHLLTLQEGISVTQFREMTQAGVRLVVPRGIMRSYPLEVRPHLLTLADFVREVADLRYSA